MKSPVRLVLLAAALGSLSASTGIAAAARSDLLPPQRRQASLDTAEKILQRAAPPPIPAEFSNPFNPPNFEGPVARQTDNKSVVENKAVVPVPGDREILEKLANRMPPAATFVRDGKPILVMGRDRFEVGTRFIVTFENQDYELELVSIDRTTFTLRYRSEEYTRPIRPVK